MKQNIETKEEIIDKLREELRHAYDSPLYQYRVSNNYQPVAGSGNYDADILLIGEAPGEKEAKEGNPFVGAAGKVLDSLLSSIELDRDKVFISNIVMDRPPNNRDPLPEEIAYYAPYLDRIVKTIKPRIIATLGRFSMSYLIEKLGITDGKKISELAGKIYQRKVSWGNLYFVPLFHPAVVLYTPSKREILLEHFKKLQVLSTQREEYEKYSKDELSKLINSEDQYEYMKRRVVSLDELLDENPDADGAVELKKLLTSAILAYELDNNKLV